MVQKIIFDKEKNRKERLWFIKYWANYVRNHSDREWSKQQADLINSQFKKSHWFIKRLLKQKDGIKKIIKLYNIKNIKGYSKLLNKK